MTQPVLLQIAPRADGSYPLPLVSDVQEVPGFPASGEPTQILAVRLRTSDGDTLVLQMTPKAQAAMRNILCMPPTQRTTGAPVRERH